MSATGFLILLIVTIALLMVLIMKVKLHPTFALFASALFMGLVLGRFEPEGFSFTEVLSLITSGKRPAAASTCDNGSPPAADIEMEKEIFYYDHCSDSGENDCVFRRQSP